MTDRSATDEWTQHLVGRRQRLTRSSGTSTVTEIWMDRDSAAEGNNQQLSWWENWTVRETTGLST